MIITSRKFPYALRHKVGLEKKTKTADGAGGFTTSWEQVASLWAEIRRLRGGESVAGGQLAAVNAHLFRLRHRTDLTPEMRFIYNGRAFNIRSIHNVAERDKMLEIYTEEGVAV